MNERIKLVRKNANLTLEKFGKRIGITAASCSTIESGKTNPSNQTILSICREFRIREQWLRTGEGEMTSADSEMEKLQHFFADVLSTAPDERSAFVAALDDLPYEFWPLVADLARKYADSLKK
jgi:transcriptional regulator with XRE-family HTH domain